MHNIKHGLINYCQICKSKRIKNILNLGHQPLADALTNINDKNNETEFFPIQIGLCEKCILVQNNFIVDDRKLYKKNYHYRPGITKDVLKNFSEMSAKLVNLYKLNSKSIIADIGCNDGSLLNEFKKYKVKKLIGIEPTDTVRFAKKRKIKVVQNFMNLKSAKAATKYFGKVDLITTTNVFAHTNKLTDFLKGIKKLIKKDGIFIIENHYLADIVKKKQFDSFYHEHLRTYSLTSLIKLLSFYDFHIVDAYTSDRYGGNIQAHFSLTKFKRNSRINKILSHEIKMGLDKEKTYIKFKNEIEMIDKKIASFLEKNRGKKIIAKAFPARASILLHYFSSIKKNIEFIAEQPTSLKLNKYAPGTTIPIISSKFLKKYKPDIMIILAWHLFDTIYKKWKSQLKGTKYLKILPEVKVYK